LTQYNFPKGLLISYPILDYNLVSLQVSSNHLIDYFQFKHQSIVMDLINV